MKGDDSEWEAFASPWANCGAVRDLRSEMHHLLGLLRNVDSPPVSLPLKASLHQAIKTPCYRVSRNGIVSMDHTGNSWTFHPLWIMRYYSSVVADCRHINIDWLFSGMLSTYLSTWFFECTSNSFQATVSIVNPSTNKWLMKHMMLKGSGSPCRVQGPPGVI